MADPPGVRPPFASDPAAILEEALRLHQRGELLGAQELYEQLRSQDRPHPMATQLLGVLRRQQGHLQEAVHLLEEALASHPRSAITHLNLGLAQLDLHRPEDALRHFQLALMLKADDRDALLGRAVALRELGRPDEALAFLDRALTVHGEFAEGLLNRGIVLHDLQRHEEAVRTCGRALSLQPENPVACFTLGSSLAELERPLEALDYLDRALGLQPHYPEAAYRRGQIRQSLGQHEEALADYQRALTLRPDWIAALAGSATVLHLLHRNDDALALLEHILVQNPDLPDGLLNTGILLLELGRPEQALDRFDRLLALQPLQVEAHLNRGKALRILQRPEDALASFDRVLELQADHPAAWMERGTTLLGLHRPAEALASLDQALALTPSDPGVLSNRGAVLLSLGRPEEALADTDRALAFDPTHADARMNRGTALLQLKRPFEALASFEAALALRPQWVDALVNRGTALVELLRIDEAMACYDLALALQSDHVEALTSRGTALHRLGRHRESIAHYDRALAIQPNHAKALSNKIFVLDYIPEVDFNLHQQVRRQYCRALTGGLQALPWSGTKDLDPSRPLVIGYVSADFRRHSAAACFGPVLRHHDHGAFRIICYSGTTLEDDWTLKFRSVTDEWRSVAGLSDQQLAAQVRSDGVDILVDLSGHSEGNRLLAFAHKPAPIQITAWGHGGGTGLPAMDIHFTDPVAVPLEARALFAEASFDLPCCITFEAPAYAPEVTALPALSRGHVTFGSLSRFLKVGPEVLELWGRILAEVPDSRLLLKDALLDDPAQQAKLRTWFAHRGIAEDRIVLRGFTSHRDHLAAYGDVDIVLDTYPQNGGITTWEALWMGCPVVTLLGNALSSRLSGAILHAVGLDDWTANTETEYVALALRKSADLDSLAQFRGRSRTRIAESPAGNPELYTRAVEEAYRTLWNRWASQMKPGPPNPADPSGSCDHA